MLRDTRDPLHPAAPQDPTAANHPTIAVRRFAGPRADELFVQCRPASGTADAAAQAQAAYAAIRDLLAAAGASLDALTCETVFLGDIRRDLDAVLRGRGQVLGDADPGDRPLAATFIEQPPLDDGVPFEVSLRAVIPHGPAPWSAREVRVAPRCACTGCARTGARLVRLDDQTSLFTGNVFGCGQSAFAQAYDMLCRAEDLLREAGMGFADVVRTWIYLRDIDRDYSDLNRARREFFRDRGIELRPSSTGIGGAPFPDEHDFSISLHAATSPGGIALEPMSAATLGEAWEYGADFSRGLKVAEANKVALYVAGTASVDEVGRTVHVGDLEAQVGRMVTNLSSLLEAQGASFRDVMSAVTYVKHASDGPRLRAMLHGRGFDGFPTALVVAPICRPELLCETELVAALPREAA